NDTSGPFSLPATGRVADDWGPSNDDVRHRAYVSFYSSAIRNFSASVSFNASSARPLNITTGTDVNGDLVFNDRPDGVGRNSARSPGVYNSSAYFTYAFTLGKRMIASTSGVQITQVNGLLSASAAAPQATPRYRLLLSVSVQNLTNHANYSYGGNMSSEFFLKPMNINGTRSIRFNLGVSF
ncbi:MAG TPA: hypothetical protein VG871_20390, partial [Vicinamibacterales bacterium]|nr:hypothetical protein [Vicinamibacterales bacterium]